MNAVELFAGAGGLAMGVSRAGFSHIAVLDRDPYACETIRENKRRGIEPVIHWPLYETDIKTFDYSEIPEGVELVCGGPPCQPFSLGGKHRGPQDQRDLFPEAVRAVREWRPQAFVFENVRGLLRQSFSTYFEYITLQLTYPEVTRKPNEIWSEHLQRLERTHTSGKHSGLRYHVVYQLLNAANYGVPQRRERVFIVGFRSDLHTAWSFPRPTHSQEALLRDQWVTGDYWERCHVPARKRPTPPANFVAHAGRLQSSLASLGLKPWRTVREAIAGLPDPETSRTRTHVLNHRFNPGARTYPGHTGSPMDEPAKTLKAGDHGVPGGENMLVRPDGTTRYFTVRESARIQTFPDQYAFHGSWTEAMRQLGNAVPVDLAAAVATSIMTQLGERSK